MRSAVSDTKCLVQNASNAALSPSFALQRDATRATPCSIAARFCSPCEATNAATVREVLSVRLNGAAASAVAGVMDVQFSSVRFNLRLQH